MAQQIHLLKVEALTPLRAELQNAVDDAQDARDVAETARDDAVLARNAAQIARDGAFTNADVYASTGAGIAATVNGEQFQVVEGDELVRYLNSTGSAVEVARYPAATALYLVVKDHPHLAALVGQAWRETERVGGVAAQATDRLDGRDRVDPGAAMLLATMLSQLARQTDGGRIRLAGGTLADPALWIGDAALYQSAANTLSIAVAGIERLRVTTSGITVYGTVTEV